MRVVPLSRNSDDYVKQNPEEKDRLRRSRNPEGAFQRTQFTQYTLSKVHASMLELSTQPKWNVCLPSPSLRLWTITMTL